MIIADCTTNYHGLGNRLTILCSAYAAAYARGIPVSMAWRPGEDCQAEWNDIFEPLPDVEIIRSLVNNAEHHVGCCYLKGKHTSRQHAIGKDKIYTPIYWDAFRRCAKNIKLIPSLSIDTEKKYHSLHIRSLNPKHHLPSDWLDLFTPYDNSYLSVDSRWAYDAIMAKHPDIGLWCLNAPTANRDRGGCRALEFIQNAARDMMMLAHARSLLVVGGPSTFRNIPHIGFSVPVSYIYRGANP
jgi:hypothetical protein